MPEKFTKRHFAVLYVWMTKAKYTMGIFYVAFVFFYLSLGYFALAKPVSLSFAVSLQMVFACFFIGLAQQAILPIYKFSKLRSAVWVAVSTVITVVFTLVFGWFTAFPFWCLILFLGLCTASMVTLLLSYSLELHDETRKLNKQLEQFQTNHKKENPQHGSH